MQLYFAAVGMRVLSETGMEADRSFEGRVQQRYDESGYSSTMDPDGTRVIGRETFASVCAAALIRAREHPKESCTTV